MSDRASKSNYAVVSELLDEYAVAYYDSHEAWNEEQERDAILRMTQAAAKVVQFVTDLSAISQIALRSYAHEVAYRNQAKEGVS